MAQAKAAIRRCAVYTRKSSEEGLEQDFNSLQAQREACEAFIVSQRGEGWKLVEAAYDDGGLSGGNMERPALRRLLADIALGKVDVIVVYKVDRLTRSLSDFAKMVDVFDAHGVSFVAVTQQFNTTTSMGRLTLNVLLSFAQFEREVTGERIRDKIAASKRKGMWMGGPVPLGYAVLDRKLLTVPEEAETVRDIFRAYLQIGNVRALQQELNRRGVRSKTRINKAGKASGGSVFGRGALYALLGNPIYVGEIRHRALVHPGLHEAIVDRGLWQAVQDRLSTQASREGVSSHKPGASMLQGKLFDEAGRRLTPSHAVKGARRYRYYVSPQSAAGGESTEGSSDGQARSGWRLPAQEIEQTVMRALRLVLSDRLAILKAAEAAGLPSPALPGLLADASRLNCQIDGNENVALLVQRLVDRVTLAPGRIEIEVRMSATIDGEVTPVSICRLVPVQMKRRGQEMRMVIGGSTPTCASVDVCLLQAVARARRWFDQIATGEVSSVSEIALKEGVTSRWVTRILPLAFLAPDIVKSVITGTQPVELTRQQLIIDRPLPADWVTQRVQLGFV